MTAPRKHPGPQGPRRPQVAVRISEDDRDRLDELAAQAGVNRSEMVRRLVVAGMAHKGIVRKVT